MTRFFIESCRDDLFCSEYCCIKNFKIAVCVETYPCQKKGKGALMTKNNCIIKLLSLYMLFFACALKLDYRQSTRQGNYLINKKSETLFTKVLCMFAG